MEKETAEEFFLVEFQTRSKASLPQRTEAGPPSLHSLRTSYTGLYYSTLQPLLWYIPLCLPELHTVPGTKYVLNKHLLNKGMNK